jgi:hypothetical protein
MIFKEKIANVASRPDFLYTYDVKYAFDIVDATNTRSTSSMQLIRSIRTRQHRQGLISG